jgi:uncharacterized protein YbcV (DUF1398 family)
MDEKTMQTMHDCSRGSLDGSMTFPEVVASLARVGCEQYHADLRRQEKTYYMPDGANTVEVLPLGPQRIAPAFSREAVVAALRTVQAKQISYVEFLKRIMDAGCVGYFVNIAGSRTIYLGRSGDMYVEDFSAVANGSAN